jgi:hypothetical protein
LAETQTPDPIYWFSVRFSLVGFDCDPDIITEHLGLDPTRALRKGELRRPGVRAKYNVWSFKPSQPIEASPPHHIEMELVLRPFREALEPRLDRVATLPSCRRKDLSVYVAPNPVTPSFGFDPESLAFLGRLGLPCEIDIQNYAPDDDDEP